MQLLSSARTAVARLWQTDPRLTFTGLLMLAALVGSGIGLAINPRTIGGAAAWLKPAKFALSTAIYSLTLAWVFSFLPAWVRTRQIAGWTTAVILVAEVGIIDVQAWRGTTSHFNVATPLDATLFAVMGVGIVVQTIASAFVAYAVWHQPFSDRTLGTAVRAGMIITLVGASSGGLMTSPRAAQLDELKTTHGLTSSGSHTVGAPDGGPGLPGTGWSLEHGDLRVPHFVGLHAMQVLPLVAVALRRRHRNMEPIATIRVASASYGALFTLLLIQALQGEALVAPGIVTTVLFTVWALTTIAAVWASGRRFETDPRSRGMARA